MLTVRTFQVVFARIKANFIWAMAYNLVLIPVAMGLLFPLTHSRLPPAYAGLAMAFSSVSVVLSSTGWTIGGASSFDIAMRRLLGFIFPTAFC